VCVCVCVCVCVIVEIVMVVFRFSYKQAYLNLTFLGFYDHGKNKCYCLFVTFLVKNVKRVLEISSHVITGSAVVAAVLHCVNVDRLN